ncbi:hypothetical protein Tco_0539998 [Tanacetum coccineum]
MHPGQSLSEHINEFHKLVGDLAVIDTAISDEDHTLLLLTYLPLSYDNFVETLLYGRDTLKLEDVLATLNSRELQKMMEAKGDDGEGLYVRRRSGQRDMEHDTYSFVKNEDHVSGSRTDGYDSADYAGGNILLGDGKECRVRGTELRRNLILLGILDKEGFTVNMQSGKIKVIKGSLVVLSGTRRANCVYTLDGQTVTRKTLKGRMQLGEYQTGMGWLKVDNMGHSWLRSPLSAIGFKTPEDMLEFLIGLLVKKRMLERNMGFNESGEYKKTFIGSDVCTGSVQVLQGVEFEVEPQEAHTFEVEPHVNFDQQPVTTAMAITGRYTPVRVLQREVGTDFVGGNFYSIIGGSLSGDCGCGKKIMWITVMGRSITSGIHDTYGGCKGGYLAKGTRIESGFELNIVAGIATGALSKAIPGYNYLSVAFSSPLFFPTRRWWGEVGFRLGQILHPSSVVVKNNNLNKIEGINSQKLLTVCKKMCDKVGIEKKFDWSKTGNGDWKKIETLYMKKSLANRLYLKRKLYTIQMHPGKSQSEHIDEFHKLLEYVLVTLNSRELQKMTEAKGDGGERYDFWSVQGSLGRGYNHVYISSKQGTTFVQVLHGVEFEVEPHEDHTFEVKPHRNIDYVAVATMDKIYAHESLTFNNTIACEAIFKWKVGLKDDMDARSDVYVLSNGCKKCSDDGDGYYWEYTPCRFYNGKLVQTLLEGHFILSLKGSLSGDCDVEKNGKWYVICALESQGSYQRGCTRLDIASADVGMLDKFDRELMTDVQVFVDFDYAMGRSITVMGRSVTRYGMMIQGCAGS